MKQLTKTRNKLLIPLFLCAAIMNVSAQDPSAGETSLTLRYFVINNSVQYLLAESSLKTGNKHQPLARQKVILFLDSNATQNLVATAYTDEHGKAKLIIPPGLKEQWNSSPRHNFISVLAASSQGEEKTTNLEITKTKMTIDTSTIDGIRTVTVLLMLFKNKEWLPAKDVEMRVGVARSGGILSAGEETYTTDSTGRVVAEFKRDSLPGDQQGNFVLVAKVEDNDDYGNLLVEKTVPWGRAWKPDTGFFNQRTLWSTRFRTPVWLLLMAGSIVFAVWGTLIYLLFQIVKIKKLAAKKQV